MYKIVYKKKSELMIDIFLESYRNTFKRLYSDTGIENEYIFHKGYIENAKKIKIEIKLEIRKVLQEEIVWYRLYDNSEKSVKIYLKIFMLEIYFEEDDEQKIRFIEKIIINKK